MCPGVGPEGRLRGSAHPLGGGVCRGHAQDPAFAPDPLFLLPVLQKWQVGFLVSLLSFAPNFPQLHMRAVIFSPLQFLCVLSVEERCVHVQALQQRVQGPSLSQLEVLCDSSHENLTRTSMCIGRGTRQERDLDQTWG